MLELAALRAEREAWKNAGLRIALIRGSFDLLHAGHVAALEGANRAADRLVVVLESDALIRRRYGAGRPVFPDHERAETLGAFAAVDRVVIDDGAAPHALIGAVLPDVLVIAADSASDAGDGRDIVEAAGGTVVTLPSIPGRSTAAIFHRIKGA